MKANEFFEKETIEVGFEKIPVGMTYIQIESLEIESYKKDFGEGEKKRYKIKFLNKKGEKKEYEVGVKVIRGIEEAISEATRIKSPYIIINRQGTKKDDTTYSVVAYQEN
jgi:hypothetical protein